MRNHLPKSSSNVRSNLMAPLIGVALKRVISRDLASVVLDYRIGEKALAGLLQRRLGLALVGGVKLDVEHLALAHAGDALDAERFQRALDSLALRIEHAALQGDGDAGFHWRPLRRSRTGALMRPARAL